MASAKIEYIRFYWEIPLILENSQQVAQRPAALTVVPSRKDTAKDLLTAIPADAAPLEGLFLYH